MIRILSRKTKNNPVLIGEPGVGKTAIVEGLAQRIVRGDVPEGLKDKTIFALDMGVAGGRGQVPRRVRGAAQGRAERDQGGAKGAIILFIDELHTIVGAGRTEGSMDAGNMLKPMLARGELHCIGATTLDEYRKHIEKDAALERRFQPVVVDAPTVEDTISILRGLQGALRGAPRGAASRTTRWWRPPCCPTATSADRFLPDKAIDLMDEACAMIRTEIDSMPAELDEITRKVMQLEIEETALKKEKDKASQERLEELRRELADLREKAEAMRAQWEGEKQAIAQGARPAREDRGGQARAREGRARLRPEPAAELRHGKLPQLETAASRAGSEADRTRSARLLREEVTEDEIAEIVSRWTGIPVTRLVEGERRSCCASTRSCTSGSSARTRRCRLVADAVIRARGRHQGSAAGPSAPSSSSAPPASARPSWPRRWPRRCSTPRRTWSAST